MNISKQTFNKWKLFKYPLAWAGAWTILQIPVPPEFKDINVYSVNIPILGLMLMCVVWGCILVMIDLRLEKAVRK